jgi:CPA1 family monovalent cation:H+ antiporter
MTFAVIVVTVAVYGLGAAPLAIRLGLAVKQPQGFLLLGAQRGARALAAALQEQGVRALLVDTNKRNVTSARMAGLEALHGNLLTEETDEEIDLSGLGRLVALTRNDEINTLAAIHYAHLFGRGELYQQETGDVGGRDISTEMRGRTLAGYDELDERVNRDERIRATKLTEQFTLEDWREKHGPEALPLLTIDGDGRVRLPTEDQPLEPASGQTLLAFVPASGAQRHPPT